MLVFWRHCARSGDFRFVRAESTLVERMKRAAVTGKAESDTAPQHHPEEELDDKGEPFREPFLKPDRKLQAQLAVERLTGRAPPATSRSPLYYLSTDVVRRPRHEEMSTEQDWPSVWPVAASFRSSVVPLPVRMGTRRYPEKRAPFKKIGNLELVKIPNFLHLTPAAIERHCNAIKKFCTEYPPELKELKSLDETSLPLSLSYSDYVHQGPSIRDFRARVVTVRVKLSSLRLSESARDKFLRLVGDRYSEPDDLVTFVIDRCPARKQNTDYGMYLLTALFCESNKVEAWEKMAQRADDLKVHFVGSHSEKNVRKVVASRVGSSASVDAGTKETTESSTEEDVKQFAQIWEKCRNETETLESVRQYKERVMKLLQIEPLDPKPSPQAAQ